MPDPPSEAVGDSDQAFWQTARQFFAIAPWTISLWAGVFAWQGHATLRELRLLRDDLLRTGVTEPHREQGNRSDRRPDDPAEPPVAPDRQHGRDPGPDTLVRFSFHAEPSPTNLDHAYEWSSLYTPLRWLLLDAGLPRGRQRMFHCLRRTHATALQKQGGDPTASLGHSDPRVTWASYIDKSQLEQMIPQRPSTLAGWLANAARRVTRRLTG